METGSVRRFHSELVHSERHRIPAPVVTLLALRIGLVEPPTLAAYRKHIWFAAFVIGALFSPPDPLSLFLVSLPVIFLFEVALLLHRIMPMKSA